VGSKEDDSSVSDFRRRMIRMFNEFKWNLTKTYTNNSMNPKRTWIKKLEKTQKQLNDLKEDFNKLQIETKEVIKKKGK
jgi:hypothetical protein